MRSEFVLPILMMRPPSFMCLTAACVAIKTARTLMASVRSKSASLKSSMGPMTAIRVVDENVNAAQFRQRAFDDGDHGTGISAVSLNGQGANSERLRCLDDFA